MTEGVCIMASMKEDRGESDLSKQIEEKEKLKEDEHLTQHLY